MICSLLMSVQWFGHLNPASMSVYVINEGEIRRNEGEIRQNREREKNRENWERIRANWEIDQRS